MQSISYCRVSEAKIETKVEGGISTFIKSLSGVKNDGIINISFHEIKSNAVFFGIVSNDEKIFWEIWSIPVKVNNSMVISNVERNVRVLLFKIVEVMNGKTDYTFGDHLPPPVRPNSETSVYNFEITSNFNEIPNSDGSNQTTTNSVQAAASARTADLTKWVTNLLTRP